MAAETVRRFGIEPRVALLSHSNFGSSDCPSSSKMRQALELVRERAPELMIDGEMHGDAAVSYTHLAQSQRARQRTDFVGNTFHQATVAHKHIGEVIDDLMVWLCLLYTSARQS